MRCAARLSEEYCYGFRAGKSGALWGQRGHSADHFPRLFGRTPGNPYWTEKDHNAPLPHSPCPQVLPLLLSCCCGEQVGSSDANSAGKQVKKVQAGSGCSLIVRISP